MNKDLQIAKKTVETEIKALKKLLASFNNKSQFSKAESKASAIIGEEGETRCYFSTAEEKNKPLNKPFRTPKGPKKFSVYVKNEKGNIVKVNFGDPNMEIKKDNPKRRKSFRARHNCDNPGPPWKARYWSCRKW